MKRRSIAALFLVSLFTCLLVSLSPTPVLEVRTQDNVRVSCETIAHGDDILYLSVNSIYRVPVQERLRVEDNGALTPIEVISTPEVVYYYGIESFTPLDNGRVRAVPREVHYREVRIKIGRSGQQFLVVGGNRIALYELVAEGQALTLVVNRVPRLIACR